MFTRDEVQQITRALLASYGAIGARSMVERIVDALVDRQDFKEAKAWTEVAEAVDYELAGIPPTTATRH